MAKSLQFPLLWAMIMYGVSPWRKARTELTYIMTWIKFNQIWRTYIRLSSYSSDHVCLDRIIIVRKNDAYSLSFISVHLWMFLKTLHWKLSSVPLSGYHWIICTIIIVQSFEARSWILVKLSWKWIFMDFYIIQTIQRASEGLSIVGQFSDEVALFHHHWVMKSVKSDTQDCRLFLIAQHLHSELILFFLACRKARWWRRLFSQIGSGIGQVDPRLNHQGILTLLRQIKIFIINVARKWNIFPVGQIYKKNQQTPICDIIQIPDWTLVLFPDYRMMNFRECSWELMNISDIKAMDDRCLKN